jgi:hypothetical protein
MNAAQFQYLQDGIAEFQGLLHPKELRSVAESAVAYLRVHDVRDPIRDVDSPITTLLRLVNAKYPRYGTKLFGILAEAVSAILFDAHALLEVTAYLCQWIWKMESGICHRLGASLPALILFGFPSIYTTQGVFSLLVALIAHDDPTTAGVSFSIFEQILDLFVEKVQGFKGNTAPFVAFAKETFGSMVEQFEQPLYYLLYLLFNDLSCIAMGYRLTFLVIQKPPINQIFEILESILNVHRSAFLACPQLGNVFEGTVIQAMKDEHSLPLIVCFIDCCIDSHPTLCGSIVGEYIPLLSREGSKPYLPIYMMHLIVVRRVSLPLAFYLKADRASLFLTFFHSAANFFNSYKPDEPYALLMKPAKLDRFLSCFSWHEIALIEITLGVLKSFAKSTEPQVGELLNGVHDIVRVFLIAAIQYSAIDSFPSVTAGLFQYFQLMSRFGISCEAWISVIGNFELLTDSQKMKPPEREKFAIAEKRELWKAFLSTLVRQIPAMFVGRWPQIFHTIFHTGDASDLSPSFAAPLSDGLLSDILRALFAHRPFPVDFVIDFLVSNISRFEYVWSIVREICEPEFGGSRDSDQLLLTFWLGLAEKSFVDITEVALLKFGSDLICRCRHLLPEEKVSVLASVRQTLINSSISDGWPSVFAILNPANYSNNSELISQSFALVHLIPTPPTDGFVHLILQFAANRSAINVSLSSFDLLWQVDFSLDDATWASLLRELASIFLDDRFDVAHAAVKTFFSILSSNSHRVPRTVVSHCVSDGWPALLRDAALLAYDPVLVVVLQEISHHVCTFWPHFDASVLRADFVPLLIRTTEAFLLRCAAKETIIDTYQVYGYFLTLPHPTRDVQAAWAESLRRVLHAKFAPMRDFNSSILSHLGRFMYNVIKSFAGRLEAVPYAEWLEIVADIALAFETNEFVHITPQRAMDGFVFLFPLPQPFLSETLAAFARIFAATPHDALRRNICDDLIDVWEKGANRPEVLIAARAMCGSAAAEKLCAAFVGDVPEFGEDKREEAVECYREIARAHPGLAERAGQCAMSIC